MIAQVTVVLSSLKDKDKKAAVQGLLLMGALGLIVVSLLLRPKSPPNPVADSLASLGALFLLTPGVQALLKLRQKEKGQDG